MNEPKVPRYSQHMIQLCLRLKITAWSRNDALASAMSARPRISRLPRAPLPAEMGSVGQAWCLLGRRLHLARDGVDYVPGTRGYRMLTPPFVRDRILDCERDGLGYLAVHCHGGSDRVEFSTDDMNSHERGYPALLDILDGALARAPIAPVEVQGYVYDAKLRIAELAREGFEPWLRNPVRRALEANPGKRILFVSHGDIIRTVLAHFLGVELRQFRRIRVDNATFSAVQIAGDFAEVKFFNLLPDPERAFQPPFKADTKPN